MIDIKIVKAARREKLFVDFLVFILVPILVILGLVLSYE